MHASLEGCPLSLYGNTNQPSLHKKSRSATESQTDVGIVNPHICMFTGPSSPPRNLSHTFDPTCNETHVNTTFSWSLSQPSQDSYSVKSLVLTLIGTDDIDDSYLETGIIIEDIPLAVTATSVSVYLEVNVTYSVSLYVESCRGRVRNNEYSLPTDDLKCTGRPAWESCKIII